MDSFTESTVEQAALAWLESVGWSVRHGAEIAPGELAAERSDYGQVVLEQRLRDALAQLNPGLPAAAVDDAFRKLTRPEGAELSARNRAVHRLLVDGPDVSRNHVEIRLEPDAGRAWVIDTSTNGTRLNGVRIERAVPIPLKSGDVVVVEELNLPAPKTGSWWVG